MRTARTHRAAHVPLVLALALAGCGSAPKTNYYTLAPGADPRPAAVAQPASSPIGVTGPTWSTGRISSCARPRTR